MMRPPDCLAGHIELELPNPRGSYLLNYRVTPFAFLGRHEDLILNEFSGDATSDARPLVTHLTFEIHPRNTTVTINRETGSLP